MCWMLKLAKGFVISTAGKSQLVNTPLSRTTPLGQRGAIGSSTNTTALA
jgi:hypothetical protein